MDISALYARFAECGVVTTDSRNCPQGSLFVALRGASFNGNLFALQALAKGCHYAVVDEEVPGADEADPRLFRVDDCLKALQELAREHRRRLGTCIIGITGTNGKTTTKELMAAVLQQRYRVLYTQGNLNNHIGVPLTLLRLTPEHDLAVIEMGASHPGDIAELVNIAEPDCGLITNVSKGHLEGFGNFEGVLRTKCELYDFLRTHEGDRLVFVDADNHLLREKAAGLSCLCYGGGEGEKHYVDGRFRKGTLFLSFEWEHAGEQFQVQTHLIGNYNLKNALAAIAVGLFFEVPARQICEALEAYVPHNNRSQLTETEHNHLIVDAYNANPTSMRAAIENFRLLEVPRKVAILGDMKELGASSLEEHQAIVSCLKECDFEQIILVGEEFAKADPESFVHYPDVEALKAAWLQAKPQGCYILIKGSNSTRLWQLPEFL